MAVKLLAASLLFSSAFALPLDERSDPAASGRTCTNIHPKGLKCGVLGSLTSPVLAVPAQTETDVNSCRDWCLDLQTTAQKNCVAFSFDTANSQCSLYDRPLNQQGFKKNKKKTAQFFNKACFNCTTPANPEILKNGNFENATANDASNAGDDSVWYMPTYEGGRIGAPGHDSGNAYHLHVVSGADYYARTGDLQQYFQWPAGTTEDSYFLATWDYSIAVTSSGIESYFYAGDISVALPATGTDTWRTTSALIKPDRLDYGEVAFRFSSADYSGNAVPNEIYIDNVSFLPAAAPPSTPLNGASNVLAGGDAEGSNPWTVSYCPDCASLTIAPLSDVPNDGSTDLTPYGANVFKINIVEVQGGGNSGFFQYIFNYPNLSFAKGASYKFSFDYYAAQGLQFLFRPRSQYSVQEFRSYSGYLDDRANKWQHFERIFSTPDDLTNTILELQVASSVASLGDALYFDNVQLVQTA